MNVLLLSHDLYHSVGGGQTVYKRLIETNPEITFYYLGVKETANDPRPKNARMVPFREHYGVSELNGEFADLTTSLPDYRSFLEASNIAASVAGVKIDVVDIPDYQAYGYLLAPALRHHGQEACKVALALHGNLSETQRVNWGQEFGADPAVDQREQWQYRAADIRYGLSRDYLEQWEKLGGVAGHYLNPLRFLPGPKPARTRAGADAGVSLQFIGRTEGFKGPDLFIQLLTWLPAGAYRAARIIGPGVPDPKGIGSEAFLKGMAERRSLQIQFHPTMGKAEMAELFATRSVTVLPSRMDTFNLTALESLFAGCPTAISSRAGVCRFLADTYPKIPYIKLDLDRLYTGGSQLLELIRDYDAHRDCLVAALESAEPIIAGPTLSDIYQSEHRVEPWLRREAEGLYQRLQEFHRKQRAPSYQRVAKAGLRVCEALYGQAEATKAPGAECDGVWWLHRKAFYAPENSAGAIDRKVDYCGANLMRTRVDRGTFWCELARLERMRGNDFIAATYDLRAMRAAGEDRLGRMPLVTACLRANGFSVEAETAIALYGPKEKRLDRARALLETARTKCRILADRPYEFVEDSRPSQDPRLSIIVSLYKAANKLETFLRMLAQLPWIESGEAELVLIDSHSPTDEHAVFRRVAANLGIKAVYARTEARETIQTAWNRGILLARAPYLSFLGVDEMVRPECFALLAGELDRDPSLDWVQGNAIITEVDMQGNPRRDVMLYQRIPYDQDLVYLETCYLSWVGGMYRKSIHDRLGYYDETFGAAGDTEFKNRILPFIRSKTLPLTLGVFLNYPEERTTASPRAEVEDLRAWYLHRSEAGVEYALSQRPPSDALALLRKAVGYRKSYGEHASSDLDYAHAVATVALKRTPSAALTCAASAIERTLQAYRDLDWLRRSTPRAAAEQRVRVEAIAVAAAAEVRAALGRAEPVFWLVFNDNRYEQHSFLWQGKALEGRLAEGERMRWSPHARDVMLDPDCAAVLSTDASFDPTEKPGGFGADAAQLVLSLRARAKTASDAELGKDLETVAQYLQDLADDKKPGLTDLARPGALLCRILSEHQLAPLLGNAALFNPKLTALSEILAEATAPFCGELADALAGLTAHGAQFRAMELAARLLSYKSPQEAAKRHAAELSHKILDTLMRAGDAARAGGNQAYYERICAQAAAVQAELAAAAQKKAPGLAA